MVSVYPIPYHLHPARLPTIIHQLGPRDVHLSLVIHYDVTPSAPYIPLEDYNLLGLVLIIENVPKYAGIPF